MMQRDVDAHYDRLVSFPVTLSKAHASRQYASFRDFPT
jgi:hypothetical protein